MVVHTIIRRSFTGKIFITLSGRPYFLWLHEDEFGKDFFFIKKILFWGEVLSNYSLQKSYEKIIFFMLAHVSLILSNLN